MCYSIDKKASQNFARLTVFLGKHVNMFAFWNKISPFYKTKFVLIISLGVCVIQLLQGFVVLHLAEIILKTFSPQNYFVIP